MESSNLASFGAADLERELGWEGERKRFVILGFGKRRIQELEFYGGQDWEQTVSATCS